MTRRERARRTRLPPLQVLVPDLDRVASISPPCRAENELFPSHSPPRSQLNARPPSLPRPPLPKGNTNVYTANAYYRQLMEAAGEIKSASAVDLSVKMKGAAPTYKAVPMQRDTAFGATPEIFGAANGDIGRECSRTNQPERYRQHRHGCAQC